MRLPALCLVLLVLPLVPVPLVAMPMTLSLPDDWLTIGINLGAAFPDGDGSRFQYGIEASWFRFLKGSGAPVFFGAYADLVSRSGGSRYASFGPEIGLFTGVVNPGIDGGFVAGIGDNSPNGFTLRFFFSVVAVPVVPYLRGIWYAGGTSDSEIGVLLKLPIEL